MHAIYHTTVDELSLDFINMLKKQFAHAKIDIVVNERDETDYLNSSKKNKALLENAIKEVESSILISKTESELNL